MADRPKVLGGTHWLHGKVWLNVAVPSESQCQACLHRHVCDFNMSKRCSNYEFGTSAERIDTCYSCSHRYTHFPAKDEEKVPCFSCPFFIQDPQVAAPAEPQPPEAGLHKEAP